MRCPTRCGILVQYPFPLYAGEASLLQAIERQGLSSQTAKTPRCTYFLIGMVYLYACLTLETSTAVRLFKKKPPAVERATHHLGPQKAFPKRQRADDATRIAYLFELSPSATTALHHRGMRFAVSVASIASALWGAPRGQQDAIISSPRPPSRGETRRRGRG